VEVVKLDFDVDFLRVGYDKMTFAQEITLPWGLFPHALYLCSPKP